MPVIAAAVGSAVIGILALRLAWGRSGPAAGVLRWAGWAALALAILWLGRADGAWGIAIGSIGAMAAALAILTHSGMTAPRRAGRAARVPAPEVAPELRSWRDIAGRSAVFLLIVPGAGGAALLCALALQALARTAGWSEADGIALGLLAWPTGWAVLATWAMLKPGPLPMLRLVFASAAPAAALFWLLR